MTAAFTVRNLKIRVAGETDAAEVDYLLDIVKDFPEDFGRFGHLSGDTLILEDAHAKRAFLEWLAFNDTVNRLINTYVTLGVIEEEDAVEISECDEVHSLPVPDQDLAVYRRLMDVISQRNED